MDDLARTRERFHRAGVAWHPAFDLLGLEAPDFVDAFLDFSRSAAAGSALTPKDRQLIQVALAVATTHLDRDGAAVHIREAARLGATRAELVHVCQFSTLLGIHTMPLALSVLVEEAERAGHALDEEVSEEGTRAGERFVAHRGVLPEDLEPLLRLDPGFLDAYRTLSRTVVSAGLLEPKLVELIIVALDVSSTHLFAPGARLHVRNALAAGATISELMEVIKLTSALGISGTALGVRLVDEAFAGG
ncbi:carboxymuconolactone decarboxylase family protein [Nocardioides sp. zg-ZUI104]|uniref:carboxymuconolactone decarboxylase family protein n=1 Tax=Nocardioides faecalis TaxID=2803858 RepID=UPI001BCEB3FE|nr:carboxymuconolactone decarboxylase family protein [Nocardioides faecalis]MBS4751284.1 carboxymuconolactone decarboxylase family protein [Nocardioides faecalis]